MLGIVLAAGLGERMGGRKARLLVPSAGAEEPLAAAHARRLFEAGATRVVVVLRPEDAALPIGSAIATTSTEPDQAGSLARGLDALAPSPEDVVVVTPVDALPAKVVTVRAIVGAFDERGAIDAIVPTFGGRGGHPVAARASVLLASRGRPLRDALSALGDRRARLAVDDPAVTTDLDTPEMLKAVLGGAPRFA